MSIIIAELRKKNAGKYGEDGWAARFKSLITEILEKESGDFDFITRKLYEIKGLAYFGDIETKTSFVLNNWEKCGRCGVKLKKEQEPGRRVRKYSLEQKN